MDFSHTAYFAGQQPYQFIGIPPLTPSHSHSAGSEDYNTTSPPEVYPEFPNEPFQGFDTYATTQFNPQQAFPGPPTPPNQQQHTAVHPQQQAQQQHAAVHPQQQAQQQAQPQPLNGAASAAAAIKAPHPTDILPLSRSVDGLPGVESQRGGSNSDDEELTPAQSRRKAQNRAAQRAFRERKERHVKDLEAKLATLEQAQQLTTTENERLKRDLQKMSTENEILRATSSMPGAGSPRSNGGAPTHTGPLTYNPTEFYTDLLANHNNKTPSHRVATSDSGERLYAAGAAWDYIISHEMFKKGLVDVADISNKLKNKAKCDGQGPVFEERAILLAIEQSVGSGSDELL